MRLTILPGKNTDAPTKEQITFALEKAYAGLVDAVILTVDVKGYHFIQIAGDTQHIEYREGEKSPIFAADEIPLSQCVDIFNDFAEGGNQWKTGEHWYPFVILDKKSKTKRSKEIPRTEQESSPTALPTIKLIVRPGATKKSPTKEEISSAVHKAHSAGWGNLMQTVILTSDTDKDRYILIEPGGPHVESRAGTDSPIFAADDVPLSKCKDMFWDFAQGGNQWQHAITWYTPIQPIKYSNPKWLIARNNIGWLILMTALAFVTVCGACGLLSNIDKVVEPATMGGLVLNLLCGFVWLASGGIAGAMLHTEKLGVVWSKTFLFILLGLASLFFAGQLWLSYAGFGFNSIAFLSAFVGIFAIFFILRLIKTSNEFERDSNEVEGDHYSFRFMVRYYSGDNDSGWSVDKVLNYVFLDKFLNYQVIPGKKEKEYQTALAEKRLHVFVRYLPRDPKLHRVRIELLDKS
jgi:hypothetical protein